jgi:hypothetical protein
MSPRNSWRAPITGSPDIFDWGTVTDHTLVLIIAGLTSVGTYILGVKGLRLPGSALWEAIGKACECIGLALIFLLLNLTVGVIAVFAARVVRGEFVSLYHTSDATLLVLSLLQALVFQAWREGSRRRHTPDARDKDLSRRDR